MGVLKGVRAKKREKEKTSCFQSLEMFFHVKNENFQRNESLKEDISGHGYLPLSGMKTRRALFVMSHD